MPESSPVEWRPVEGATAYKVNEIGEVWSGKRGRRLKPHLIKRGPHVRVTVMLKFDDGRWITKAIAHLVLAAFVGPRPPGTVSRHMDSNGANNRSANLVWGTQAENVQDAVLAGRQPRAIGESNSHAKLTAEKVLEIRKSSERVPELAKKYGVSGSTIHWIRRGLSWKHLTVEA